MSKFYRDNDEDPLLPKTMGEALSPHGEWYDEGDVPRRTTRTRRQIIRRHVLRFFVIMSLVWLVHVFVKKGKRMANGRIGRFWNKNDKHIDIPPWITLEGCAELSPESGVAVEFDMPLDRAVLYSTGGLAKGSVVTRQSNSTSDFALVGAKKTAKVIVTPIFSDPAFVDYVQVCKIKQQFGDDESYASRGVGILTVPWSSEGFGHFEMEVILPASAEEPLEVGGLAYETVEMENRIGYLPDTHFKHIRAYADYRAPISAGYVSGRFVSFETDRYPIWGTFATESMIYLKAKKAPVSATVHLHDAQDPASKDPWDPPAVTASIKAVNAALDVNAHLTSANGSHGNFYVETHTALSDINLLFETAPVNSTLKVDADTSVGTARVLLHPTYDGSYRLEAPFMWRKIWRREYEEGVEDPAGLGRSKVLFRYDDRLEVLDEFGDVFWVAEGESGWEKRTDSRVWVKSTAGRVSMSSATHPAFDPTSQLTPELLSEAAAIEVFDEDGLGVKFGSLFEDTKIILVFIRHFFCGSCQAYVEGLAGVSEEALSTAGVKIAVIGCGEHSVINRYREITKFKGAMYADPSRTLYRALGMTIESFERTPAGEERPGYLADKGFLKRTAESIFSALKTPAYIGKQGNFGQLGGDFVVGPGLQCSFASRMKNTEDHVPVERLLKEAGVTA